MKTGGRPITGTAVSLGAGCILLLTGVVAVRGGSGERLPQTPPRSGEREPAPGQQGTLTVADFLPKGYVTDGSVGYQQEVQRAIDAAARAGATLVFPPMVYRVDEAGLEVRSGVTLWLYEAVFRLDEHRQKDGQVFLGKDVTDVQFLGGEIAGRNDAWPAGVNIQGIHLTGLSRNVRIRDVHIRGLSSNGIGVFGGPGQPARDVWVTDVVIENCCNRYGDDQRAHAPGCIGRRRRAAWRPRRWSRK